MPPKKSFSKTSSLKARSNKSNLKRKAIDAISPKKGKKKRNDTPHDDISPQLSSLSVRQSGSPCTTTLSRSGTVLAQQSRSPYTATVEDVEDVESDGDGVINVLSDDEAEHPDDEDAQAEEAEAELGKLVFHGICDID
ncbi:hypothetical protein M378DRAFT_182484 [Amanita muscaria Koide BX008]|uniref:Uncharacterized protein n=1 Tax=Amanita muscaria (strain Koide BX008) TaxID=946122 RepID=A0A0C2WET8_AMAMK|nr:hypothetical protein M378DRAFT_182484 [Amanita muscaria Koide BX008]